MIAILINELIGPVRFQRASSKGGSYLARDSQCRRRTSSIRGSTIYLSLVPNSYFVPSLTYLVSLPIPVLSLIEEVFSDLAE